MKNCKCYRGFCRKSGFSSLYDKVMECRRDEISNLWKRSTLLTALIVIVFSGYGGFLLKFFSTDSNLPAVLYNGISAYICVFGVIISQIWIMTSKISKYWVDRYELLLSAVVERDSNYESPENFASVSNFEEINKFFGDNISKTAEKARDFEKNCSEKLLSNAPFRYSPSKINIVIGQVAFLFWGVLLALHILAELVFCFGACFFNVYCCLNACSCALVALLFIALPLGLVLFATCKLKKACTSNQK